MDCLGLSRRHTHTDPLPGTRDGSSFPLFPGSEFLTTYSNSPGSLALSSGIYLRYLGRSKCSASKFAVRGWLADLQFRARSVWFLKNKKLLAWLINAEMVASGAEARDKYSLRNALLVELTRCRFLMKRG